MKHLTILLTILSFSTAYAMGMYKQVSPHFFSQIQIIIVTNKRLVGTNKRLVAKSAMKFFKKRSKEDFCS